MFWKDPPPAPGFWFPFALMAAVVLSLFVIVVSCATPGDTRTDGGTYIGSWVYRIRDESNGVSCYVYTSQGGISCVKDGPR